MAPLAELRANYRKENVFYSELRSAFGDGLLTSQDAQWQRQKRFLQPLFVSRRVDGYAAAMSEQVHKIKCRWRSRLPGVVDRHEEMTRLTLATVCRILFGADLGQVLPVVQRTFGPLGDAIRLRALAGGRVPRSWPTPVNQRLRRARQELHGVCGEIVARRRANGDRRDDLLGLLLDAREGESALTDAEIREQVLVFLLAGYETTAVEDDQIGSYHIPAGTEVVLAPWITHRHPQFWDQPERFEPERFTPELERARHRYAWFPFGGGPRACIGQHFSMLESVIALAMLVRDFEFAAPPGEPPRTNHITLRPTQGVPSHVTPR